jgi:hypothetical protein
MLRQSWKRLFIIGYGVGVFGEISLFLSYIFEAKFSFDNNATSPYGGIAFILIFVGMGIALTSLAQWKPSISKKSEGILAALASSPMIAFIAYLVLNSVYGSCFFPGCDTQIEIISMDVPKIAYYGTFPKADFVVKNIGDSPANNCKLVWDYPTHRNTGDGFMTSNSFSLAPLEEEKIHLIGDGGVGIKKKYVYSSEPCSNTNSYEKSSRVYARCDNADTGILPNIPLLIECPNK